MPVVAGFQGVDDDGNITTIGRGGSDTTRGGAGRRAEGRRVPDPHGCRRRLHHRSAPGARGAPAATRISFEEMLELAGQGSRVLHLRSVEFAAKYNVPLRVLSSFGPGPGTLICKEDPRVEAPARRRHRVQS